LYRLYLSGFDKPSWKETREAYQAWREKNLAADAAENQRKCKETPPQETCPQCGVKLDTWGKCPECGGFYTFDETQGKQIFCSRLNAELIAAGKQKLFQEKLPERFIAAG
jgi:hypothetical protein